MHIVDRSFIMSFKSTWKIVGLRPLIIRSLSNVFPSGCLPCKQLIHGSRQTPKPSVSLSWHVCCGIKHLTRGLREKSYCDKFFKILYAKTFYIKVV